MPVAPQGNLARRWKSQTCKTTVAPKSRRSIRKMLLGLPTERTAPHSWQTLYQTLPFTWIAVCRNFVHGTVVMVRPTAVT